MSTYYLIFVLMANLLINELKANAIPIPNLCEHSSRFDSITQYVRNINERLVIEFFVTSGGYYWTINITESPTHNNTKGRLPDQFRGDAAFFRQMKSCEDKSLIPMIVVVDKNSNDLNFTTYFIGNQTWSGKTSVIAEDFALKSIYVYKDMKSVDTIVNFANIRFGPFATQLGDENIFIFTSAQNNSLYYDWIKLNGCVRSDGTFTGTTFRSFGGLLSDALWPMSKPIDAALVYTEYPYVDPSREPTEADVSLFQDDSHFQFSIPLKLIANGYLGFENLRVQYYSKWLGCAKGPVPETWVSKQKKVPKYFSVDLTKDNDEKTVKNETNKWRPHKMKQFESQVQETDTEGMGTTYMIAIGVALVVTVVLVLVILSFLILRPKRSVEEENDF